MARRLWIPLLALFAVLPAAAETLPAVARPRVGTSQRGLGTAFFLRAGDSPGTVAVTAAHWVDLTALSRAKELRFVLGGSGREVAKSTRFYAAPGTSLKSPGGDLLEDHMVFALNRAPIGVRILQPSGASPSSLVGQRVRVMGIPAAERRDQEVISGKVVRAGSSRIEVELDGPEDIQGWGGAPVLSDADGKVIGILLAAWPSHGQLRLGVAPIASVLGAIAHPLDGGVGRPFARYAPAPKPSEAAATGRASLHEPPSQGAGNGTGPGNAGKAPKGLDLELHEPANGEVVNDPDGAFVSGRAVASAGSFKHFDVMIVIDTSGSTAETTGTDVNGNGVIGRNIGPHAIYGNTDPGDSVLAAEVAAARRVIRGLDPRSTRVGLISFAGTPSPPAGSFPFSVHPPNAVTRQPLTTDYRLVRQALDLVLAQGPYGMTDMAEAIRLGIRELQWLNGGTSTSDPPTEKVMLFFTDGIPTLPYLSGRESANIETVFRAADAARRAGIKIDSFAIGHEALQGVVTTVEMAARTGGRFTPVRHPGQLVRVADDLSLANIEKVEIRNLSNGRSATVKELNADGSFGALVPIATGKNRIDVVAYASDGSEAHREVTVLYAPDAPRVQVPAPYVAQHNRLVQRRLVEIRRGDLDLAQHKAEVARKELRVEIDRERAAAEARAAAQKKELDLEIEKPPASNASKPAPAPTP